MIDARALLGRLLGAGALLGAAAASMTACGDLYADPGEGAPEPTPRSTNLPTFVVDSGALPLDTPPPPCPPNAPREDSPCSESGLTCEYGSSADTRCNTSLVCTNMGGQSAWIARPSTLCPTYDCPRGKRATIDGAPCDLPARDGGGAPADGDELVCTLDDAVCACSTGPDAAHAHERRWVCVTPPSLCPIERPLSGQECGSQPLRCDYGSCAFKRGLRMECNSVWLTTGGACN